MDYSSYIKEAFGIAKDHGFHDVELPVNHFIMLIITEISEMVEADRKNKRCQLDNFGKAGIVMNLDSGFVTKFENQVKDNLEDEMADACIKGAEYHLGGCVEIVHGAEVVPEAKGEGGQLHAALAALFVSHHGFF